MKKLILYFVFAMLIAIIGCFIHVMNISSSLGKILLLTGSLIEVFIIYKMITHRKSI